jgi:ATP-dependent RNA helicase DeaD
VGSLDLYNDFSFFEVDKSLSDKILEDLKGKEYDDKSFVVEIASNDGGKKRGGRDRNRGGDRDRNRNRGGDRRNRDRNRGRRR